MIDDRILVADASHTTSATRVVGAFRVLTNERIERIGRLRLLAGGEFSSLEGAHGLLGDDPPSQRERVSHEGKVFFVRHVVETDFGRMAWIRRDGSDRATRFRAHVSQMQLEAVAARRQSSVVTDGDRQEMKLNVGIGFVLGRSYEAQRFKMVACSDACLEEHPSGTDKGFSKKRCVGIERNGFQTFVLQVDFEMVLQVFSDGIEGVEAGDVGVAQRSRVADP